MKSDFEINSVIDVEDGFYGRFKTPSGSASRIVYSPKVCDDGSIELIESGKENFYDYIQSFRESCDIHIILKKALNGDDSGLRRVQGFYADITSMPKTRAEMLQVVIDAERNFNSLPLEIKERFDNDFNKFFVSMDKPEWRDKMNFKKEEVEINEQEQ